jgi:hypothetical protein
MSFNISALDAFRNAQLNGEDAIANVGKDNTVSQKGSYHGALGAIFRLSSTRAANNAARTEFLRSLGNAFGLEGIGRNAQGVTTFSRDFMDKLERLLGPDFNRDDFKVGADGTVSSGKPLTQRRITAIIKQATIVGKGEYDYSTYKTKLNYVKGQIEGLKIDGSLNYAKEAAVQHFEKVAKLLEFAEKELPRLIDENYLYDPNQPAGPDNPKYVLHKTIDGDFSEEPLTTISAVTDYIQTKYGELFHVQENILGSGIARFMDLEDPQKQITDYLTRTIQAFVMTSVDLFIDAEKAGKTVDFMKDLSGTWPCVEGKTSGLIEFRLANLPEVGDGLVVTHDKDQPLDQCMGREIGALMERDSTIEKWEDVADQVKQKLVGIVRPISVPVVTSETKNDDGTVDRTYKFKPLLGATGQPIIRAITEEDIDKLGKAVVDTILFG